MKDQTMKELGENEYGQKFDADGELTERGGDRVERRLGMAIMMIQMAQICK